MPNRYVKDRARRSPSLEALSDAGERLFWRLKLAADDYGRFEADPRVLVAECRPLSIGERGIVERTARAYAELCAGEDPICRTYRVGGRLYGVFRKWDEVPRAKASKHPAPPYDPGGLDPMLADDEQVHADAEHVPVSALVTGFRSRSSIPIDEEASAGRCQQTADADGGDRLTRGDANGGSPFASWPPDWTPLTAVITASPYLTRYHAWLVDLDWWREQDERFTSCPLDLDELVRRTAAYLAGTGYRPASKRGLLRKLYNCLEVEARKADRETQAKR